MVVWRGGGYLFCRGFDGLGVPVWLHPCWCRAPPGGSKRPGGGTGSSKGRGRRRGGSDSDSEGHAEGEEDELQFMTNKWSAVTRAERYRTRLQENGEDTSAIGTPGYCDDACRD